MNIKIDVSSPTLNTNLEKIFNQPNNKHKTIEWWQEIRDMEKMDFNIFTAKYNPKPIESNWSIFYIKTNAGFKCLIQFTGINTIKFHGASLT